MSSTSTSRRARCAVCNREARRIRGQKKTISSYEDQVLFESIAETPLAIGDLICGQCRLNAYRQRRVTQHEEIEDLIQGSPNVSLNEDNPVHESRDETDSNNQTEKCAACNREAYRIYGQTKIITSCEDQRLFESIAETPLAIGDLICGQCRLNTYKRRRVTETTNEEIEDLIRSSSNVSLSDENALSQSSGSVVHFEFKTNSSNIECIEVPISRTISTHKYCCICHKESNLIVVPEEARVECYRKRKIFIPEGNRCCQSHFIKNRIYQEDMESIKVYSNSTFMKGEDFKKIMDCFADECNSTLFTRIGEHRLSEEQIHIFTGLTWENINKLSHMMTSMRENSARTIEQALIVFLIKLRTGNSNRLISTMLQLEREQHVSDYSGSIIDAFKEDILPTQFGLASASREDLIQNHTTEIAKILFDAHETLILICDGTYARHEKSTNSEYQRKSFSAQKKTHLCKPFTICTTDGYVLDMLGPYTANMNDAEIMKNIIHESNDLCKLMRPGDIFVLDRGFRDVKSHLEEKGYRVLMPVLKGQRKQLTAGESNESRFVTKVRWVVEAVHGMMKSKNHLLDQRFDNKMIHKVGSYYQIAAFLLNIFGKRLNSDVNTSNDIIRRMLAQKDVDNSLALEVEEKGWLRKRLPFENISSEDLLTFPELTENDLKIFFTGTYQYSQAISYLGEMLNDDGTLKIQYVKDQSNIIKISVQSRHISRKAYRCFIEYTPDSIGCSGIKRYCCECANGRRTVGCCSHIAAIIYYLSYGRYISRMPRPAEHLSKLFQANGIPTVIDEDSDED